MRTLREDGMIAATAAVRVGCVEGGDACLPGGIHDREGVLAALTLAEESRRRADAPEVAATEDDSRDAHARLAQVGSLHVHDAT